MDTRTRHALKQDSFAKATASSFDWISGHRSGVLQWVVSVGGIVILAIAGLVFWSVRTSAADSALGVAMDTYGSPLAMPGAPAQTGVYATATERSLAAHGQFVAAAAKYNWLPEGAKARYFAAITDQELGNTAAAEAELKQVSGAWNRDIANLAKLALAGIYRQTGRDAQAIDLYDEIAAKPSETVSANVAQLDLADLYAASGKLKQARDLWGKVKDADKDGAAGMIALQKLAGK